MNTEPKYRQYTHIERQNDGLGNKQRKTTSITRLN